MTSSEGWPAAERAIERARRDADRAGRPGAGIGQRLAGLFAARRFPPGVYILTYHSVVDLRSADDWELAYDKGRVSVENFRDQVTFLAGRMASVPLSEVPAVAAAGPREPVFCVTFDDGYANVPRNCAAVLERLGIRPAFFANGRMAGGGVYYRVLAALLRRHGHAARLAAELRRRLPDIPWSEDAGQLFAQTKSRYVPYLVEEAVEAAFAAAMGDPARLGVHCTFAELRDLARRGWEIGNHTYSHVSLQTADARMVGEEIERNVAAFRANGIDLIPWLAYPNGTAAYVAAPVKEWLDRNPQVHGVFGGGGVNLGPSRTEWWRLTAEDCPWRGLAVAMRFDHAASRRAVAALTAARAGGSP